MAAQEIARLLETRAQSSAFMRYSPLSYRPISSPGHKTEAVYRRHAIAPEADLREGLAKLANLHVTRAAGAWGRRGKIDVSAGGA